MAAKPEKNNSPIQLTIATAEVSKQERESILFYVLPPLLVVAVFIYCICATPDLPPAAPAVAASQQEQVSPDDEVDDFSDEDFEGIDAEVNTDADDQASEPDASSASTDDAEPSTDTDTEDTTTDVDADSDEASADADTEDQSSDTED